MWHENTLEHSASSSVSASAERIVKEKNLSMQKKDKKATLNRRRRRRRRWQPKKSLKKLENNKRITRE